MREPEQHFSPESIDQLTERSSAELPTPEGRLIADLYQTYASASEENSRSLQRIWSRFVQARESQGESGSELLTEDVHTHPDRLYAPVPGSFQQPPRLPSRETRRIFWRRLSSSVAVAVILLIALILTLLAHVFLPGTPHITLGATLTLDGGSQPGNDVVFLVKSSEGGQYLAVTSFDTYVGHTWSNAAVTHSQLAAGKRIASESSPVHLVIQQITVIDPSAELMPYVLAAGLVASVDQPATLLMNRTTGSLIAVLLNNGQHLTAGERYTVQSYVSSADIAELRAVPLPVDAPNLPRNYGGPTPITYYNPAILRAYLQLPKIDPRVKALALQLTTKARTMYDRAVALQDYFRTSFTYSNTIHPPGTEATAWLLFQSDHRAFCNYFASAMAVMARELGMPARVVVGYTGGIYDSGTHNRVIHASDAHAWTQVYFAGYGWINFEPSPGFPPFAHPVNK